MQVKLITPRVVKHPIDGPVSQKAGEVVEMTAEEAARAIEYGQATAVKTEQTRASKKATKAAKKKVAKKTTKKKTAKKKSNA